MTPKYI